MSGADGLADLWIDGKVYRVPPAVVAHMHFLHDLNRRLVHVAQVTTGAAKDLLEGFKAIPPFRWTPLAKEELLLAIREGRVLRVEAMQRFELSEAELDGWIDRYDRHGLAGLSVRNLQEVGR